MLRERLAGRARFALLFEMIGQRSQHVLYLLSMPRRTEKCNCLLSQQITGLYRAVGGASNGSTSGVFRTLIIANNVAILGKDVGRYGLFVSCHKFIRCPKTLTSTHLMPTSML